MAVSGLAVLQAPGPCQSMIRVQVTISDYLPLNSYDAFVNVALPVYRRLEKSTGACKLITMLQPPHPPAPSPPEGQNENQTKNALHFDRARRTG